MKVNNSRAKRQDRTFLQCHKKTTPPSLTARQQAVLDFIRSEIKTHQQPPSLREIMAQFGIGSTNGARIHLLALELKGYIQRNYATKRGIKLTDPAHPTISAERAHEIRKELNYGNARQEAAREQ